MHVVTVVKNYDDFITLNLKSILKRSFIVPLLNFS